MMRNIFVKRFMMVVLIFTFISGGTIFAEENDNATSLRLNFPDVPDGNWAQKHVSKLVLLGVTDGFPSGNYNPAQEVIQQDVIKMALSLMGYEADDANIEATQPNHILQFLNEYVDPYAQPFVSLAFKEGILDFNTELSNVTADEWGQKKASREWVAKVVIQAIGQTEMALELSNTSTDFNDNLDISTWALGYVNAAVELNIVTGSNDGNFYPKNPVTRAEIAAFLSRGEHYLTDRSDRVIMGTVTNVSSTQITIINEEGQTAVYTLHQDQKFYSTEVANNAISRLEVNEFVKVYLIVNNDIAYYVEVTNDEPQLVTEEGILIDKSFDDINNQTITILVEGDYLTYSLDSSVTVLNTDGSGSSLGNLINKSTVTVTFNTIIGQSLTSDSLVKQIAIKAVPVNKESSGTLEVINVEDNQISLRDESTGAAETYFLADEAMVTYGIKNLSGISELTVGDTVDYEVVNSLLTLINITNTQTEFLELDQGIIYSYSLDKNILTIKSQEGYTTREFAEKVEVILKGTNAAGLNDLEIDDEVNLEINGFNEITKVEVLNREIMKLNHVEIIDYNSEYYNLSVVIDDELKHYTLSEDTVIEYASQQWNLANFDFNFEEIFVPGKKVDMIFTNDKLMEVRLASYYDGIVKDLNVSDRTITIETENGDQSFDLLYSTYVVIYSETSTNLSDLSVGDSVRLILNSNQSQISRIELKQSVLFSTVSTNPSTREITVRDQLGKESKFTLNSNIPLTHHAKSISSFSDILANELLIVTYYGKSIISVEIPDSTMGILQEINDPARQLTIRDYNNQVVEVNWSATPKVYEDSTEKVISTSNLQVDDRVVTTIDSEGQLFITRLEMINTRRFWKYENASDSIFFRDGTWNAEFSYSNVYLHQDGTPLELTDFNFLDHITYYLLNGVLIEVEKH